MGKKIVIDPITRVEGHLKVEIDMENKKVIDARCSGMLYRGLEKILVGRDPRDACQITQRICGVCPMAHASASSMALDDAFGISEKIPDNALLTRNLIHMSNHIHNSILHFYHLSLLDYINMADVKRGISSELDLVCKFLEREKLYPFVPGSDGFKFQEEVNTRIVHNYIKALEIRRILHEALAVAGGKMPHQCGIVPGGITQEFDVGKKENFIGKMKDTREFIELYYKRDIISYVKYYPEYLKIGKGVGNFLAYGCFPYRENGKIKKFQPSGVIIDGKLEELDVEKITESVKNSWYEGDIKKPGIDFPEIDINKEEAYSWIKSPRYNGNACEVGPLARIMIAYFKGLSPWKEEVDNILDELNIKLEDFQSVAGRHIARYIEAKVLTEKSVEWALSIKKKEPFYIDYEIPDTGEGIGLSEGARGAVGHWLKIENKKISHYQVIAPTTWNGSPKDGNGNPGPIETALLETVIENEEKPVEVLRIVRSFDPCLACAVQMVDLKKLNKKGFSIWI